MQKKVVYILHKNGANSHYSGLKYLLEQNGMELKYREFSVFGNFFKSIFKFDIKSFKKQVVNLGFLIQLIFSKNKKIVFGIAPFDNKIERLFRVLKNHEIYYHTSWTCWDGTFQPKGKKMTKKVMQTWRTFLENGTEHIFTVTQKSKQQLIDNYNISQDKISVVYHALQPAFLNQNISNSQRKKLSFIYLGRLLPEKGIMELLDFFAEHVNARLTIIGDGKDKEAIETYGAENKNISVQGFMKDKKSIIELIRTHEYLVLNSKRTSKWEELFGLVIIECMSQGTIPVATNHSGPKEIINEKNGFLCEEGKITEILKKIIEEKSFDDDKSKNAIETSQQYDVKHIAKRWIPILN